MVLTDSSEFDCIKQAESELTVIKLNGSDTMIRVLSQNQSRMLVFSIVKLYANRRRGSFFMHLCMLLVTFIMFFDHFEYKIQNDMARHAHLISLAEHRPSGILQRQRYRSSYLQGGVRNTRPAEYWIYDVTRILYTSPQDFDRTRQVSYQIHRP